MRRGVVFALSAMLAYGTAFAQSEEPQTGAAESAHSLGDDETLNEASKLSHAEKKSRAEEMLAEMRETLARGSEILAEARQAKDVVQLNCVNEKLVQIKGLLKIGEQSSVRMYEGIAEGADDVVNHEYTRLAVAHQRGRVLRAEAEQCVGENVVYTGETEVEVEVDDDILEGDPTDTPFWGAQPETPEVASEF
ncbi:MAG: hypothetical protein IT384_20210 [Deltaproteobacteria bacterium]|nr:hypothetical protein [Deltaproteobacteria bacterium]